MGSHPALELGIGDDAAVINAQTWNSRLLIAQDQMCEGVHFRIDWSSPDQLAHKLWVCNLSDLSAMGSKAQLGLLSLGIPKSWPKAYVDGLLRSLAAQAEFHGVVLVGGDTTSSQSGVLGLTLMGPAPAHVLRRSQVKAGHGIYINKIPGASWAGLQFLQGGIFKTEFGPLVQEHLAPSFDAGFGAWLGLQPGVGACMDLSDDLLSSLEHLALSSGVSLHLDLDQWTLPQWALGAAQELGVDSIDMILGSGEEYGLLWSADPNQKWIKEGLAQGRWMCLGQAQQGSGVSLWRSGQSYIPQNLAFRHF